MPEAVYRNDRHVHPVKHEYRLMTYDELNALHGYEHLNVLDMNGMIAEVHVTSIKRWKRTTDIVVNWKFGQYTYGHERVYKGIEQNFFIKIVEPPHA